MSCSLCANVLLIFALEHGAAALPDCADSLRVHAGQLGSLDREEVWMEAAGCGLSLPSVHPREKSPHNV